MFYLIFLYYLIFVKMYYFKINSYASIILFLFKILYPSFLITLNIKIEIDKKNMESLEIS
jgi:hypothetical protein